MMEKLSLPELIELVQKNNEMAFNELYRRFYRLVRYIAFSLTKNHADTEEVSQEVFIQVQRSIHSLSNPNQFKGWISSITYSKAKMLFRKKHDISMEDQHLDKLYHQEELRDDYLPTSHQRHLYDTEVLLQCMQQVKPEFRDVLIFYYFAQLSIKEIADMMALPEGTVKSRMLYGKKYLRIEVEEYEHKNGVKLDFKERSLESALLLCASSLCNSGYKGRLSTLFHRRYNTTGMSLMKTCLFLIFTTGLGYGWVQYESSLKNANIAQTNQPVATIQESEKEFTPVQYQGQWITTPRKAYQELLDWADCEVELRQKTPEEMTEIRIVYDALYQYGAGYLQLLHRRNWDTLYLSYS